MKLKEFKCKKSYFNNVDRCKPRNLINKFYWDDNDPCTENMHGTNILRTNSYCSWHDSVTNKPVKTDLHPNSFMYNNLHHNPGEPQKIYIWKQEDKYKKKYLNELIKKRKKDLEPYKDGHKKYETILKQISNAKKKKKSSIKSKKKEILPNTKKLKSDLKKYKRDYNIYESILKFLSKIIQKKKDLTKTTKQSKKKNIIKSK